MKKIKRAIENDLINKESYMEEIKELKKYFASRDLTKLECKLLCFDFIDMVNFEMCKK